VSRLIDRFPRLVAALLAATVSLLTYRAVLQGRWLVNPMSDQRTGYAFRAFAAAHERATGEIPQWYGHLFGGMPFAANTAHGDTFFPTALLRLWFGVDTGMSLGFVVFTALAGWTAFLFARTLGLRWGPAVLAGGAYMLSGQVISLVSPGHDGKLYVSALLPLALLALHRAVTRDDWRGYLGFGAVVGASLLSPHFQMTYYLLMAAGFWWGYLVFLHDVRSGAPWWMSAGLFAGALVVGFALAAVQLIPFLDYLPYSPRGAGGSSTGYEYATSFSMPLPEVLATVWPQFFGSRETYWGTNPLRLHSNYLGVAALVLATLGLRLRSHRRLAWFFWFLAGYALLFALGGNTPFYRIPYTILPGISKTRAPDMIFYLASLSVAMLAAFGVQALGTAATKRASPARDTTTPQRPTALIAWGIALALVAVLAVSGGAAGLADAFAAPGHELAAEAHAPRIAQDGLRTVLFGGAAVVVAWLALAGRMAAMPATAALALVVVGDEFTAAQPFVLSSPPARELFAADSVVRTLKRDSSLNRVLPLGAYGDNYLMSHGLRSVLGYNGNELQRYDELLGGKNVWGNVGNPNIWRVAAIKYVVTAQPVEILDLALVTGPVPTYEDEQVYLYRVVEPRPYAWLVPEAVKVPDDQVLPTLLDQRFDPRRLLLVPRDAPVGREALDALPAAIDVPVTIREPQAGVLEAALGQPAPRDAYLYVAENWYPDWTATVDGRAAPVVRAQHSMMAVQVPAGARNVRLTFTAPSYTVGKGISLATLALVLALGGWGIVRGRRDAAGTAAA
jgi:hypothetical protein